MFFLVSNVKRLKTKKMHVEIQEYVVSDIIVSLTKNIKNILNETM